MDNPSYKYNPNQNHCSQAELFQSVLDENETKQKLIDHNKEHTPKDIYDDRIGTLYSCSDNYKMGTIQDNQIYIATTDPQHDQIAKGEHVDAQGGLSGYFSDQATIDACKNNDVLDNTKYNEACQIAPYREDGLNGSGDAQYKPHIDCFNIDRDALYKNYGTYDFNAAISKCEANNQFGSGGGNQGYNPYINEMIDNCTLNYNSEKSFSDKEISNSEHCNKNPLSNSIVPEDKADKIYDDALTRSKDCVNNNTPHPSENACKNGFDKNDAIDVGSSTGNATSNQVNGTLPGEEPAEKFDPLKTIDPNYKDKDNADNLSNAAKKGTDAAVNPNDFSM